MIYMKNRKSIRHKGWDYGLDGYYFVTICTKNQECLFGKIMEKEMVLNHAGEIIKTEWEKLPNRFPNIKLDTFVVMPNHFHGIIVIQNNIPVGAPLVGALVPKDHQGPIESSRIAQLTKPSRKKPGRPQGAPLRMENKTIGDMVGAFKSLTTNEYIHGVKFGKFPPFEMALWQRDFYDHIVRDENELNRIREYIRTNPINWTRDGNNKANIFM